MKSKIQYLLYILLLYLCKLEQNGTSTGNRVKSDDYTLAHTFNNYV